MLPEDSTLTLFYTEAMGEGLENAHLSIHFYNEETRQWEDMGGVVDRQNRSVSAPVKRYGIYALVKVFHSYLPIIIKCGGEYESRSPWSDRLFHLADNHRSGSRAGSWSAAAL